MESRIKKFTPHCVCRVEWIRKIAPTLVANTNWTAQQRRSGYRDNTTKGLLPKAYYDRCLSPIHVLLLPLAWLFPLRKGIMGVEWR